MSPAAILWFRRDLRTDDHPALARASELGDGVAPVFVVDDVLARRSGLARSMFLSEALRSLNEALDGCLHLAEGPPAAALLSIAKSLGAQHVVATAETTPYGQARDEAVAKALEAEGISLHLVDTNYAVAPGLVTTQTGTACKVFTAYKRGWESFVNPSPIVMPAVMRYTSIPGSLGPEILIERAQTQVPALLKSLNLDAPATLPRATTQAAHELLANFAAGPVSAYEDLRNVPGVAGTSQLSAYLRFGLLHPRTVLASVSGADKGSAVFRSEICWREFYADVLFHRPESATQSLQPALAQLRWDEGPEALERFAAWTRGETGYPIVDAGMRQLLAEGWMHNRVRMLTASFLVKSLHLDWRWGAAWFMLRLVDGDLASNQHGWQWTAGTGTDASPFHRIFNPSVQAQRFDPEGDYVHRYIPELAAVEAPTCLEPGGGGGMLAASYPEPMVDHATERQEALARFALARDAFRASQ